MHGIVVAGPVRMEWDTDHQCVRLPFTPAPLGLQQPGGAFGANRRLGLRRPQQPIADRDTGAFMTEVEGQKSLKVKGDVRSREAHACPASGDKVQACRPSSDSALL